MSAAAPTILVVDDAAENLDVLRGLLQQRYVVRAAISGELALRLALIEPVPDLILLDVMMPQMDGYEVCRRLKANPLTRDIPVIFVTAMGHSEHELQGLELGAVDYLTKPVVPAIVQARVETHLALGDALRRLKRALHEIEARNLSLRDEKELLEDIVMRMQSACPFDARGIRHIQRSLERACGDIVLSACRPDGAQHVLVGDFSGHGLAAAFAGPLVSSIFYSRTADGHELGSILAELNRTLCEHLPAQIYMTASAVELPPERAQVHVWNYGMQPVLYLGCDQDIARVKSCGLPLGISVSSEHGEPHVRLAASPMMRIYQYSDGITEAASPGYEQFGEERLSHLVGRIYRERLPLETVWDELERHCEGGGLSDDAVLVETAVN